jgi:hypothetical protein
MLALQEIIMPSFSAYARESKKGCRRGGGDRSASLETFVSLECQQCLGILVFGL